MSVHQTKTGLWFCKFYLAQRAKRKYFGHGDIARKQAEAYDQELKDGKRAEKLLQESSPTIADVCAKYHEMHPRAHTTSVNDFYKFKCHIIPILGNLHAENIAQSDIDTYIIGRLKSVKWGTVKRELVLVKAVMSWASKRKIIHHNPLREYQVSGREDKDVPMPPTEAEVSRIISAAEPHAARAITLLWHTGMRPGEEIERLRWSDVDLAGRSMRVVSSKKTGRGLSIRYVPISEHLAGRMEEWRRDDSRTREDISHLAVVHYFGTQVHSLKRAWSTAKRRAGITRRIRLYDLRHRFATQLLEEGMPAGVVSKLLGHSREDTTQRHYLHVTQKHLREAVNLMPGLNNYVALVSQEGQSRKVLKNANLSTDAKPSQG